MLVLKAYLIIEKFSKDRWKVEIKKRANKKDTQLGGAVENAQWMFVHFTEPIPIESCVGGP